MMCQKNVLNQSGKASCIHQTGMSARAVGLITNWAKTWQFMGEVAHVFVCYIDNIIPVLQAGHVPLSLWCKKLPVRIEPPSW